MKFINISKYTVQYFFYDNKKQQFLSKRNDHFRFKNNDQ